jgi:GNAT superfamily N-acetyltransferase
MSITYQQEFLDTVEKDIKPLLQDHWEEIAVNKSVIKMNPDWEAYHNLEDNGALKIFTARFDGELIGYFVVLIRNHIHYKDHIFAANDVLFLKQEHRKGLTGPKLMKFAEKCLKEDGVSVLVVNTKRHKPFDGLLEWLGYSHVENVYSKYLR